MPSSETGNALDADGVTPSVQATVSSSEPAPPTLQNRRGWSQEGGTEGAPKRASETLTSHKTQVESVDNDPPRGLQSLAEAWVQNKSYNILSRHTRECAESALFLSQQLAHGRMNIADLDNDDPRVNDLREKLSIHTARFLTIVQGMHFASSLPKPSYDEIHDVHYLGSERMSEREKGREGNWMNGQDPDDHCLLSGGMSPIELLVNKIANSKWSGLKPFEMKPQNSETRRWHKSWMVPRFVQALEGLVRLLMLGFMILPVAARKMLSLEPGEAVALYSGSLVVVHLLTCLITPSLEEQMLLTMTVASVFAEALF